MLNQVAWQLITCRCVRWQDENDWKEILGQLVKKKKREITIEGTHPFLENKALPHPEDNLLVRGSHFFSRSIVVLHTFVFMLKQKIHKSSACLHKTDCCESNLSSCQGQKDTFV